MPSVKARRGPGRGPGLQRRSTGVKSSNQPQRPLMSRELCTHCCTPFADMPSDVTSVCHPLWPNEVLCSRCKDILARCSICERKAVPWAFPKNGDGDVQQFDVLLHTEDGDGILSPRVQINHPDCIRTRCVCGRCRAIGLICTKDQAIKEMRFILESMYLHFGILFSEGMLELQTMQFLEHKARLKIGHHKMMRRSNFKSTEDFDDWLSYHCDMTAKSIPINLVWGRDTQLKRSECVTDYYCEEDDVHPSLHGLPYIETIRVESHVSRPKFWSMMVHELVHAYLHLLRGLHPKSKGTKDSEERIKIEEGLCHAVTHYSLQHILTEIAAEQEMPIPRAQEIGAPPVQLWMMNTNELKEDLSYSKPPPTAQIAHWAEMGGSPYYNELFEEFQQINFFLSKLTNDSNYQAAYKRAVGLIRSRERNATEDMKHTLVNDIIEQFVVTDHLPKS